VSFLKKIVRIFIPGEHPRKLEQQALAAGKHYEETYDLSDLRAAVEAWSNLLNHPDFASADKTFRARVLNNAGRMYQFLYERSGEGLERAIAVQEEAVALTPTGHPDRPGYLNDLGDIYRLSHERSGEYEPLQCATKSLEEAVYLISLDDSRHSRCLNSLGNVYLRAYEYSQKLNNEQQNDTAYLESAIVCLKRAVELTPEDHPNRPAYLSSLGYAYSLVYKHRPSETDKLDCAIEYQKSAVELAKTNDPNYPVYLNNLGSSYAERYKKSGNNADLEEAIVHYQKALSSRAVVGALMTRRRAGYNLGRLLYDEGRYHEARAAFEQVHKVIEQLNASEMDKGTREGFSTKNANIYARLVFCCLKENDTNAALEYAAAGKGRAFVDMLGSARPDLNNILVENSWSEIERKYPTLAATQRAPSMSAEDAMQLAKDLGATLVEYYQHRERWGAFVVTPDEVRWVEVEEPQAVWEEYERWVTELKVSRYNPPYEEPLTEVWRGLYTAVFAPLVPFLSPEKPLVIAPFGWLHRIPLGLAQDPKSGEYICNRYQISFAPSLSALWVVHKEWQKRETTGEERALVVMHPGDEGQRDYEQLKQTLQTATEHVGQFFKLRTDLHEKQAVVREVTGQARDHALLHFFCHGKFSPQEKKYGLLLESDMLTVDHIVREMILQRTRLVSLGACVSAMVDIRDGEEHVGLPWALLTARAQGVIGSLWPVDADPTVTLFHWFYQHLAGGASPAEALRQAMREIRETEGWEAPYYWGAFQAIGMVLEGGYSLCRELPLSVHPPELEKGMQMTSGGIEMQDYEIFVKNAREMLQDMSGKRWDEVKERLLSDPNKTRTLSRKLREVIAQNKTVEHDPAMVEVVKNIFRMVYDHKPLGTLLLRPGLQLSLEDMEELDVETDRRYVADMHRGGIHNELVGLEGKIEQLLSGGLADEPTAEEPRDQPEA
jgi:CHAT domain-containing protein